MKKQLLILFLLLWSAITQATTYYVSSSGSDANNGTSIATPFMSISKVNSLTLVSGDEVLFKKGDVFYGSLIISQSGSLNNPITYGAYGTGNNPVITGFTAVTSWKNLGDNIWESTDAVSTLETCNMVTVNGVNTAMGRWPNSDASNGGYLTFQSHSGKTSITSSYLTGTPDWTGAEVVIRTSRWTLDRTNISSQSGNTIVLNSNISYEPQDGYGFFIQNDARTLDVQNEWYYNPTTKKIRIYSTTQPTNVNVASVDYLMTINADHITIKNISIEGSNNTAIHNASSTDRNNVAINYCLISFSGKNAIRLSGSNLSVINNTIAEINNNGIDLSNSNNILIQDNIITSIGITGMGNGGSGNYTSIASWYVVNAVIKYNRVVESGYNGISANGDSIVIQNNYINNFCSVLDDGAGIYTWTGSNTPITSMSISGNIINNGIGATLGTNSAVGGANGIYLDDNSENIDVSYNTVFNCVSNGVYLHNSNNTKIYNNVLFNNYFSQIRTSDDNLGGPVAQNTIHDNIFFAKSMTQLTAMYGSVDENLPGIGTFHSNYYSKPISDNSHIRLFSPTNYYTNITLAQWKTFSSQDANSLGSPITVSSDSDIYFYYNPTKNDSTVVLLQPGIDVTGQAYASPIILAPYSSIVILRDSSTGTYYYVSSSTGNDSNSGTQSLPWASLTKVNSATLAAKDRVLFKSGDSWYGQLVPKSGSALGDVVYSSYGTGNKPLIHSSSIITSASNWTNYSGNIWKNINQPIEICNLIFNNDSSFGKRKWSTGTLANQGDWFWDSSTQILYLYSNTIPSNVYQSILAVIKLNLISASSKSYITIDGLALKYGDYGFVGSNTNHITIKNCDVAWIGGSQTTGEGRKGNGIEFWSSNSNALIQGCKVWECFDAGISNQSEVASTVMNNIIFRNNQVWNCEYSYEYFNTGSGSSTSNISIENNTFYNAGYGWGHNQRESSVYTLGYHLRLANRTEAVHSNFIIRNNILSNSIGECQHNWDTTHNLYTINNNLYYQPTGNIVGINFTYYYTQAQFATYKSATGWDANSILGDPKFIGKDIGDFRLLPLSPARSVGYQNNDIGALPYTNSTITKTVIINGKIYTL